MKIKLLFLLNCCFTLVYSQNSPKLSIEKIMQDPKWIGSQPSGVVWSENSSEFYFNWNPEKNKSDSVYKYHVGKKTTIKLSLKQTDDLLVQNGSYSKDNSLKVFAKNGDLYLQFLKTFSVKRITQTVEIEFDPKFTVDDQAIVYKKGLDLFLYSIEEGTIKQLTDFDKGSKVQEKKKSDQENWLAKDQIEMFEVLKIRKDIELAAKKNKIKTLGPKKVFLDEKRLLSLQIDPTLNFVTYSTSEAPKSSKNTIVPNYVTESGFTEDIAARTKVGAPLGSFETFIYSIKADTVLKISTKNLPGITDLPDFLLEKKDSTIKNKVRNTIISELLWSPLGTNLVGIIRAQDNKDRWIVKINPITAEVQSLDRQRDEAWVAGPGIGGSFGGATLGWLNEQEIYFQSEITGYSHLYKMNVNEKQKQALTKGNFEVLKVELSNDKSNFYIITNEVHPGEQHFYHLPVNGGVAEKITKFIGAHEVTISPDEKLLAIRYSYPTKPWELFIQKNEKDAEIEQITNSLTEEFKAYSWKDPKLISFKASDGQEIFGRIYEPTIKNKKNSSKPAVLFVHGAGYLQNAHKWWSSYFREYMFHNLLADLGYTVFDIDYRASAGYGRNVRTGIYRHMGGKDLSDHVDAANFLVKNYGVDAQKIGIYGGSYGGFITLMALFTTPDVFKAGAALRPVTDWAAYNHGYTSNILNEPKTDSISYKKSSPIYFANGLKNNLLICHGVVDVNVHYQDVVRLSQRLIELKKDNWELASYPVEDHGFVEPSSWTDEYKRILKLFEEKLR